MQHCTAILAVLFVAVTSGCVTAVSTIPYESELGYAPDEQLAETYNFSEPFRFWERYGFDVGKESCKSSVVVELKTAGRVYTASDPR